MCFNACDATSIRIGPVGMKGVSLQSKAYLKFYYFLNRISDLELICEGTYYRSFASSCCVRFLSNGSRHPVTTKYGCLIPAKASKTWWPLPRSPPTRPLTCPFRALKCRGLKRSLCTTLVRLKSIRLMALTAALFHGEGRLFHHDTILSINSMKRHLGSGLERFHVT